MTTQELRQKAYSNLVGSGVRHPMPDQVVKEMHRIRLSLSASGNSMNPMDAFEGLFKSFGGA